MEEDEAALEGACPGSAGDGGAETAAAQAALTLRIAEKQIFEQILVQIPGGKRRAGSKEAKPTTLNFMPQDAQDTTEPAPSGSDGGESDDSDDMFGSKAKKIGMTKHVRF